MNGRFLPVASTAGPLIPRPGPWSDRTDAALPRLLAALALSCLLHAALALLPFFGSTATEARFPPVSRQEPAGVLEASLRRQDAHALPGASANAANKTDTVADQSVSRAAGPAQRGRRARTEGANLLPLPGTEYFSTDQLSKRPQPLAVAELDTPQLRPIVASGRMVLKLWINEFGMVVNVSVEKSELPIVFSRAAVSAFKSLRFEPGELNGRSVATVMRIEVNYDDGRAKPY